MDEHAERRRRAVVPGLFTVLGVAVVEFVGGGAAVAQPGATQVPVDVQQQQDIQVVNSASALGSTLGSGIGSATGVIVGAGVGGAGGCVAAGLLSGVTIPVGQPVEQPVEDELEFSPSACITGGLTGAGSGAGLGGTVGGPVGGLLGTGTGALVGSGLVIGNHLQAEPPQQQTRQVGRQPSHLRSPGVIARSAPA